MGWEMVPVVRCGGDEVLLPVLLPWGTQRAAVPLAECQTCVGGGCHGRATLLMPGAGDSRLVSSADSSPILCLPCLRALPMPAFSFASRRWDWLLLRAVGCLQVPAASLLT